MIYFINKSEMGVYAMKRIVRALSVFVLLLLACGFLFSAHAELDNFAFVKRTKATLYSSASMSSRSRYVYKYEIVTVESTDSVKAKVKYGEKSGYMYLKDLTMVSSLNREAVVNRNTKVYTKPSTSASKSSVSKNTPVTVLMVNGSWAMIERSGKAAYIKTAYLSDPSAAQPSVTPTPKPADKDSYVLSGSVTQCDFDAYINASSLSVYAKASASSTKLGTLKRGSVVRVYAYNGTWAYIELNSRYGYCKKSYLRKIDETTPAPAQTASAGIAPCEPFEAKTNTKIYVYASSDDKSEKIGQLKAGVTVEVQAYSSDWAYIHLNGNYGYTQTKGLTRLQPAATPTPVPTPTPAPTATPAPTQTAYVSTDPIFTNTSTSNEQKIYQYLTSETEYNEAVACGILANIKQESNFNPTSGKGKSYQGLCQWSTTRFAILEKWCAQNGFDPYSLEGQIKFLKYDLSARYTLYHKALKAIENTSEGAYEAGYYFCYHYERPASLESSSVARGNKARDVYWPKYAN